MNTIKILLVDDEPDFISVIGERIEGWGYDLITAENGAMAVDLVKSEKPDVVILDYMMPEMDGLAVLKEIRKIAKKIPVIMFTAFPDKAMKTAKKLGVDAFIPKVSEYGDATTSLKASLELITKKLKNKKR
jgi:CheY-like chemotaxis protein